MLRDILSADGEVIDQGLVLWFPGPSSFTGEDVFELQLHGGLAIIEAVTKAVGALGARLAEPGEFTRRAFEAGRLELSQAEAVADLVDAETEAQRRQAIAQLGGSLARRGEAWRENLITALAFLEAQIDFPDEEIPEEIAEQARAPLNLLLAEIEAALEDTRGERIRDGLKIALIGAPNAGKSSLLNALIQRDAAIVTPIPGATRDVIEAPLVIEGYKVLLADMAGIRDAVDEVEIEGVRRARAWAESADLRLWLVDRNAPVIDAGEGGDVGVHVRQADVLVLTKSDQTAVGDVAPPELAKDLGLQVIETSTVSAEGIDPLRTYLKQWVVANFVGRDAPAVTRLRHRALLEEARAHLARALDRTSMAAELMAEDVRLAARALERLSGQLSPDAVLDRVFGSFCIGK